MSAFEFGGVCMKLLDMAKDDALENVKSILESYTRMVTPTEAISAVQDDPDDNWILECAKASGSNAIITRDKHLLRLGRYEGIAMLTVADFLRGQV